MKFESFEDYFYLKFIQGILYNDKMYSLVETGYYDSYLLSDSFYKYLYIFITNSNEGNNFDFLQKKRLYSIISYLRYKIKYIDDLDKEYYYNFFNELIIIINNSCTDNYEFYKNEMLKRFKYEDFFCDNYDENIKVVKKSLGLDFIFLFYQIDIITDEQFLADLPKLIMDKYYLFSINAMLDEYPELLLNKTFKNRLKKVLSSNKDKILENEADKILILVSNYEYQQIYEKEE